MVIANIARHPRAVVVVVVEVVVVPIVRVVYVLLLLLLLVCLLDSPVRLTLQQIFSVSFGVFKN